MSETGGQLSDREREILEHVANGATNQQIANNLGISVNTVKVHVRNIFGKIGVASRAEATLYAVRAGIVSVHGAPDPTGAAVAVLEEPEPMVPPHTPPIQNTGVSATSTETTMASKKQKPTEAPATSAGSRVWLSLGLAIVGIVLAVVAIGFVLGDTRSGELPNDTPANPPGCRAGWHYAGCCANPDWNTLAPLEAVQEAAAAVNVQGSIYLIGGVNADGVTGAVRRYDPDNDTWRSLANKPTPVTNAQAAVVNGLVYVPGGELQDGTTTNVVEVYDPVQGTWSTAPDLPTPRSGYGLVAFEGQMYLLGGTDGETIHDEVYVFDPDSESWSQETTLPTPRAYGGAAVIEGKIYVVGGENDEGLVLTLEIYDPVRSEGQWTASTARMPEGRTRFGLGVIFRFIVVMGGTPAGSPLFYDFRNDLWRTFNNVLPPVEFGTQPAIAVRDDALYIVSGEPDATASD
ncbi:MAG: hypothetical protein HC828_20345, partial [Blastochloris sp.]|nr:hypothetical protein [Blastochloris sp.]